MPSLVKCRCIPNSRPGLVTDALTKAAAWRRQPPASAFHIYSGHLSVAKIVFHEIGGFDEQFCRGGYGGEDLDLGLRLVGRYDVRHNQAAVAWQRSLVGPHHHMRRARQLALSDLQVIAKHPHVRKELLANRGVLASGGTSLSYRLSGVPLLGSILAPLASWSAEIASRNSAQVERRDCPLLFCRPVAFLLVGTSASSRSRDPEHRAGSLARRDARGYASSLQQLRVSMHLDGFS